MAGGRLVVMTNETAQIKGDCKANAPYADQIKLSTFMLGAGASIDLDDKQKWTGHVSQGEVTAILDTTGPWVAELQAALFAGKKLGKVTLTEISQTEKEYAKVREVVLADAYISGMSCSLNGTSNSVNVQLSYATCTVNWGDKVAFFDPEGKYSK